MANQITLKPVIARRQQRPDGTYNVKIRVTFKRKSRFLSTTITAPAKDVDKAGNLKGESLTRGYKLIAKFQGYLNDLDFFLVEGMDVDDVTKYLRRAGTNRGAFKLDFFDFAEKEFLPAKSVGTANTFRSALNSFRRYLGGNSIDINDITKTLLVDFALHVDNEPKVAGSKDGEIIFSNKPKKKGLASSTYLSKLREIFKLAVYRFNDEDAGVMKIPRNPFNGVEIKIEKGIAIIAQEPEVIQRLIDFRDCRSNVRYALDVYLLSFALMGINPKDMYEAVPPKGGIVIYNRAKVRERRKDRAEHHVEIDERIMPLVEKYKDPSGERLFNFYLRYKNPVSMSSALRYGLQVAAEKLGIPRFTIQAARHSWATIAQSSRCGVNPDIVDYSLVHVGAHKLLNTYAEKDWQVFWDANKKVLDIFDWSAIQK